MIMICLLPVLLSWFIYQRLPPEGGQSYGQLLPTVPFEAANNQAWPKGKWVLVSKVEVACQFRCQDRFFAMRQIHLAQGEAASRINRVALQESNAKVDVDATLQMSVLGSHLPKGEHGYYLIDPLGNQVLFYPDNSDPKKVIKEITQVLKTNNGLG
ncbi:hypothetical protein HZU77_000515 [Neisseriaceae bacterium TC5R-5]|nr:hypothetical protein [Neisseriaceae bacterium TC5R-5]